MNNKLPLLEIVFSKKVYKFLLFLGSYMLAVIIPLIPLGILRSIDTIFGVMVFLFALVMFPEVLNSLMINILPSEVGARVENWGFYLVWITYLLITLYAVFVKNSRTAKILYTIFVLLLILNIVGFSS